MIHFIKLIRINVGGCLGLLALRPLCTFVIARLRTIYSLLDLAKSLPAGIFCSVTQFCLDAQKLVVLGDPI